MLTSQIEEENPTQNRKMSRKQKLSLVFLLIQTIATGLVFKSLTMIASSFGINVFQMFLVFFFVLLDALANFMKSSVIAIVDSRVTKFLKKIRCINFLNCLISLLSLVGKVFYFLNWTIQCFYLQKNVIDSKFILKIIL